MKIFLDTSSLFKLYHQESGTAELEQVFVWEKVTQIFLSELAKIEFASTLWKKVRTRELTTEQAETTLELFENDFGKFIFIAIDSSVLERAKTLIKQ